MVFLIFNFRKKAKCFAGDIGSISIAFWMVYLLLQLMLKMQSVVWLLLLFVFAAETIYTNLHRLYLKRLFLYMAEKAQHPWLNYLDLQKIDSGKGNRSLVEKGIYVLKYKITIPKELVAHGAV